MLEVGIPTSVRDNVIEQKVCNVFQEIGEDICGCDIQTVIVWRIKIKQLLNLPTEKIVFKY